MKKKKIKIAVLSLTSIVLTIILILLGYVGYISIQYYRIDDQTELEINSNSTLKLELNQEYSISTYNIGFGAYNRNFSFFMESGTMKDGTKTTGKKSKAESKDVVMTNTLGAIKIIKDLNPDFLLFQEVDTDSTRSFHINQYEMIEKSFMTNEHELYDSVFASNFHSAYLAYPIFDNHGKVNSGIATLSRFDMKSSVRYQLPITKDFIQKFFDLDRCFNLTRYEIKNSEKELVIINAHFSAYDEGGIIRKAQWEVLKKVLELEYQKGNFVIVGGDFNHDIANTLEKFPTEQLLPDWIKVLSDDDLPLGYRFSTDDRNPTNRSTDIKYTEGINYTVVIDGFITSSNVTVKNVENIVEVNGEDVNFMYSDHNPVYMSFELASTN